MIESATSTAKTVRAQPGLKSKRGFGMSDVLVHVMVGGGATKVTGAAVGLTASLGVVQSFELQRVVEGEKAERTETARQLQACFELQELGEFDTKSSTWLKTPSEIRELGGAIFGDRRFGRVFVYHNGAESYYSGRGFRGWLRV